MTHEQALQAIQQLMDLTEWDADTLENIAAVMLAAGYKIRDYNYDTCLA